MTGLKRTPLAELIDTVTVSAVHLEMRDTYTPDDPEFAAWRAGRPIGELVAASQSWARLVRDATARGVEFRRARIVSEPITDYIRFEYELTNDLNIASGERVRWLPRRHASALCLPGNDFWLLDGRLVRFGHFAGDGALLGHELTDDPAAVKLCASAFEAVWERAIDHQDYRPS